MSHPAEKIAIPYAKAAFEQAQATKSLSAWSVALQEAAIVAQTEEFKQLIFNPNVQEDDMLACLSELISSKESKISEDMQQFFKLLSHYQRLLSLPSIAAVFDELLDKHEKRSKVTISSAMELDEKQKELLLKALAKRLNTEIDLSCEIDASLLAGAVVRIGDTMIDGSLRGRLAHLKESLI